MTDTDAATPTARCDFCQHRCSLEPIVVSDSTQGTRGLGWEPRYGGGGWWQLNSGNEVGRPSREPGRHTRSWGV